MIKHIFKIISCVFALFPAVTLAHVKWFAEEHEYIPNYSIGAKPVLAWLVTSAIIIAVGIFLERKLSVPEKVKAWVKKYADTALSITSIGFGLAFVIFSLNGFIFAPNLSPQSHTGEVMIILQAILGFMILLGIYERAGGVLLLVLFFLGIKEYGTIEMLDTLEMVGFALYSIIEGRPKWKINEWRWLEIKTKKLKSYAVPLLRVGTGLNLIVLGFTEKILNPSLTHDFLSNYHWNFMQELGFVNFSDYYFAFSAGMVEVLFGVFFVFGFITRTTTIVLALFLVTTLALLGPTELIGHLPHFSIAVVLALLGSGEKLKL